MRLIISIDWDNNGTCDEPDVRVIARQVIENAEEFIWDVTHLNEDDEVVEKFEVDLTK